MKKIIGAVLILLFMIVILLPLLKSQHKPKLLTVRFETVEDLQNYLRYSPDKPPLVGAHRGGPMSGFPENAIETFRNSLKYAPCLIECDVQKTRSGELILLHDDTLDRTTTGTGNAEDYSLNELKQMYLKDPDGKITSSQIPTLEEALNWAKDRAILELDIKPSVDPELVYRTVLEQKALPHVVVISYTIDQLKQFAEMDRELVISASAHTVEGMDRLLQTGIDPERLLVFVGVTEPDLDVYKYLHKLKIRAILGTMHNIDKSASKRGTKVYKNVLMNGADILATDNVPLAAKAIREFWQGTERDH